MTTFVASLTTLQQRTNYSMTMADCLADDIGNTPGALLAERNKESFRLAFNLSVFGIQNDGKTRQGENPQTKPRSIEFTASRWSKCVENLENWNHEDIEKRAAYRKANKY